MSRDCALSVQDIEVQGLPNDPASAYRLGPTDSSGGFKGGPKGPWPPQDARGGI